MYRLRSLRGGVSKCLGDVVYFRENHALECFAARAAAAQPAIVEHGRGDEGRDVWDLHQSRRMRSRLPERDSAGIHRKDEPRFGTGGIQAATGADSGESSSARGDAEVTQQEKALTTKDTKIH